MISNKHLKYKDWTNYKTDPRKHYMINGYEKDISQYYWNLYYPNDKIVHGDGNVIHHKNENHRDNSKYNLQKMTRSEHYIWHANHRTNETTRKLSESHKRENLSEESIKNYSNARKGIKFTKEHIKNMSESHKGNKCATKKVKANFINFKSLKEAAESLGVTTPTIIYKIHKNTPGYSYIKDNEK